MIFDLMAVRLDPARAGDAELRILFVFPERQERFLVQVRHGVLIAEPAEAGAKADATLTLARALLLQSMFTGAPAGAEGDVRRGQGRGQPLRPAKAGRLVRQALGRLPDRHEITDCP